MLPESYWGRADLVMIVHKRGLEVSNPLVFNWWVWLFTMTTLHGIFWEETIKLICCFQSNAMTPRKCTQRNQWDIRKLSLIEKRHIGDTPFDYLSNMRFSWLKHRRIYAFCLAYFFPIVLCNECHTWYECFLPSFSVENCKTYLGFFSQTFV